MRDTAIRAFVEATAESVRRWTVWSVRVIRRRWRTTPPQQRRAWRSAVFATALGLAVACTAVAVSGPWDSGQRKAERARAAAGEAGSGTNHIPEAPGRPAPAPSAAEVLTALADGAPEDGEGSDNAPPAPTPSALADVLTPLLDDPALGPVRTASVVDAVTGRPLFSSRANRPTTPASTVKLATAVAVLSARGPDHRIETRVVRDAEDGRVVLVGGGDPTLTGKQLDGLARDTARALRNGEGGKAPEVSLGYDVSRYSGTWQHTLGPNDNLAPVSPLMVNAARLDGSRHGPAPRAADPAVEATRQFGQRLEEHGVTVTGTPDRVTAPKDAGKLAAHRSAPLSALVERMLTHSDNDLAEALARQTALADGKPASFEGAGRAVRQRLEKLGFPLDGARFADGSGLSRDDKVSARLLTRLLGAAADPERPQLRAALTGLPVAAFTGTLGSRYDAVPGAGVVRAKTGTLTGVNTLAGTVVDADGRMLAFAFMTTGTEDRHGAQTALDRLASALAGCGCR